MIKKTVTFLERLRDSTWSLVNNMMEQIEMTKFRRMEISRNEWKEKARLRADENREQRKSRNRDREKIKQLEIKIQNLANKLKKKTNKS